MTWGIFYFPIKGTGTAVWSLTILSSCFEVDKLFGDAKAILYSQGDSHEDKSQFVKDIEQKEIKSLSPWVQLNS